MTVTPPLAATVGFHRRIAATVAAFGAVAATGLGAKAQDIYVDDDALPGGNGGSWATAFRDIQAALDAARLLPPRDIHIRVAQGTYYADPDRLDPGRSIDLLSGVTLTGGFRGLSPGGSPDDRNPSLFTSVIDGDIGVPGVVEDNTRTLITYAGVDSPSQVIGFTLARAYGCAIDDVEGRSLTLQSTTVLDCVAPDGAFVAIHAGDVFIDACIFENNSGRAVALAGTSGFNYITRSAFAGNRASPLAGRLTERLGQNGGAIAVDAAYPGGMSWGRGTLLEACTLSGNNAAGTAGALFVRESDSHASDCVFAGNVAAEDGGAACAPDGRIGVTRCRFESNSAGGDGGAVALPTPYGTFEAWLCTFSDNTAQGDGGAVAALNDVFMVRLLQCELRRNAAGGDGGAIFAGNWYYTIQIDACLLASNIAGGNGGALAAHDRVWIRRSTIADNAGVGSASRGGGIWLGPRLEATLHASSSILFANRDSTGSASFASQATLVSDFFLNGCVVPGLGATNGNIDADPTFVSSTNFQLAPGSPAINTGDFMPEIDSLNGIQQVGHHADIGCYEAVSPTPCARADFTTHTFRGTSGYGLPDQRVSTDDFFFYLDMYVRGDPAADLTRTIVPFDPYYGVPDGVVSPTDFLFFMIKYEEGCD